VKYFYKKFNEVIDLLDSKDPDYKNTKGRELFILGSKSEIILNFEDYQKKSFLYFQNEDEYKIYEALYLKINKKKFKKNFYICKLTNFIYKMKQKYSIYYYVLKDFYASFFVSSHKKRVDVLFLLDKSKYLNLFHDIKKKIFNSFYLIDSFDINLKKYKLNSVKLPFYKKFLILIFWKIQNKFDFHYKIIESTLLFYKPKTVVFAEGDSIHHSIVSKVCNKLKIKSICLQWGTSISEVPKFGYRNFECSKVLLHGKFFYNEISKYNCKKKLFITGNHMIAKKDNKDRKKIIFLFQHADATFDQLKYNDFIKFAEYSASKYPNWNFIIRYHPHQDNIKKIQYLENYKNVNFHYPDTTSLHKSLNNCTLAITINSSTVVEALNYSIIPLVFNISKIHGKFRPDLNKLKIGFEFFSYVEATKILDSLLVSQKKINFIKKNIIKNKFFFYRHSSTTALKKIIKQINN
jgi:hypothetical protein